MPIDINNMAVLGSILFKRTLKQFLQCQDLESDKGKALIVDGMTI